MENSTKLSLREWMIMHRSQDTAKRRRLRLRLRLLQRPRRPQRQLLPRRLPRQRPPLLRQADGTVAQILVKAGDAVDTGAALVTLG